MNFSKVIIKGGGVGINMEAEKISKSNNQRGNYSVPKKRVNREAKPVPLITSIDLYPIFVCLVQLVNLFTPNSLI